MTCTADTAVRQAGQTADSYLAYAIRSIDAQLGTGFAAKNPELVAAFMRTCAADFATWAYCERTEAVRALTEEFLMATANIQAGVETLM